MRWNLFITKYFGLFFAAAIILGLLLPGFFIAVSGWIIPILAAVMTLTFLSVDPAAVYDGIKKPLRLAGVLAITKIALPALLYCCFKPAGETAAAGVLLLTLTPVAAVAPTLTGLTGGDREFSLVLLVLSTLLAPLYMPAMLFLLSGSGAAVDTAGIMKSLALLVALPFSLSLILRPAARRAIEKTKHYYGAVNIILISILLAGLLASAADAFKADPAETLPHLLTATILGFLLIYANWLIFRPLERTKRLSLAVCGLYMNIGMTAVIAAEFFGPEVLLFVLVYEIPANLLPQLITRLPLISRR